MKPLVLLLSLLLPCVALAIDGQAGSYHVSLTTHPTTIELGQAKIELSVTDSSGVPVEGAKVGVLAQMPGMPMGEREEVATPTGVAGHYLAPAVFGMAGAYDASITIRGEKGEGKATLHLQTGQSTASTVAPADGSAWVAPVLAAIGALVLAGLIWRRKSIPFGRILKGSTLGPLFLLGLVLAGAWYVVGRFRPPGAMTPIEAQTMDMEMPAPPGVAPVTLATITSRSTPEMITYPGQVVALSDADVAARTTGTVEATYVYVGDHVKAGQLLARLDVSQLEPELAEKQAGLESAKMAATVAEADAIQASAMVHQAESEKGQFEAAVPEVQAMLEAAKQGADAATAQREAAQSAVQDSNSRVLAARADATYWTEELKREAKLLQAGAVSKAEFSQEQAEAQKADAALAGAKTGLDAANAGLRAADAQVRKANAEITAESERVKESQSALMVHHAHVQMAQAETESSAGKVGQAKAGVQQARAALDQAAATRAYAELRAPSDGVVTARLVSPGSLVNPGQIVFRVSSTRTLRIQANVTESDLSRVRLGDTLLVRHRADGETPVRVVVSSISPSVDPVSRMGTVEGLFTPQPDRGEAREALSSPKTSFLPGEYISVDVPVSASEPSLRVPAQAVQTSLGESGNAKFVWLASPVDEQPGRFTVRRQRMELGTAAGDFVEVRSGLHEGDRVVLAGGADLADGDTVAVN